jgi:PAS domain S-box-containing protein
LKDFDKAAPLMREAVAFWAATVLAAVAAGAMGWWLHAVRAARLARASADSGAALLDSALASAPIAVGYVGRDLRLVRVNQAFARLAQRPAAAHRGRHLSEALPPPLFQPLAPALRRALDTGVPSLGVSLRLPSPDPASARHFLADVYSVPDPRGERRWAGLTILDVTAEHRSAAERERLVEALRESEARFRALAESGVLGVVVAGPDRIYEANDAFLELVGYSRAEMHAGQLRWAALTTPEEAERHRAAFAALLASGACPPFETEYIRRDWSVISVVIGAALTRREPVEWACFVMDVSERKLAQAERRETEERYRSLFDRNPTPMWVFDHETLRFLDVNQAAVDRYGWSREEFLGMTLRDIRPPSEREALEESFRGPSAGVGYAGRVRHWTRSGAMLEVDLTTQEVPFGGRRARLVLASDVTARVRAEQDVHKFVALVESAGDGIAMATLDGRIFYANAAARRLAGLPADAPPGGVPVLDLWDAESRQRLEWEVLPLVATGRVCGMEGRLRHGDAGEHTDVECSAFGIYDARGERVLAAGFVFRDLTERKRVEEHLRQAQRMEAIGRVAGGVAHEVNNMMTVILGFCTFLAEGLDEADQRARDVGQIARAAERAANVSRQLLAYSRRQLLQPSVLELNGLVTDMEPMIRRLMGEDRDCRMRLAPQLAWVRADRTQLEQVILNLTLNARDAMPTGGSFSIETDLVVLGAEYEHRHPGTSVRPGPYVRLTVTDSGRGIEPAVRAQIFEPFFTTKPVGEGTGLGLSTAYGIVKQSGGYIWVYSEPGLGAAFKVYLPQVEESGQRVAWVEAGTGTPRGLGETVLVVEDEELLRDFACRFLEGAGYRTLVARDGPEAIALLARRAGSVDLVLCDLVMPGMSGRDLAAQLTAADPGLPIVFTSGYTDDEIVRRGLLDPGAPFLQKPFSPDALARIVRDTLDATRARYSLRRVPLSTPPSARDARS